VKIPTARLKQIIKEELFYRDFYREDQEPEETQKAIDKRAKMVHEIRDMGDDLLREMRVRRNKEMQNEDKQNKT
jgi:hypothetical protein